MEMVKNEIELAQQIEIAAKETAISELLDLQLTLVGGGSGNDMFC